MMSAMELVFIAFSTFLGAAVALAAERLGRARDAKLKEEAAINNLIIDLAAKRAFLVDPTWVLVEDEMSRVAGSVMHARDLIREARIALRPRSKALPHLRAMTQACNTFLELTERTGDEHLKAAANRLTTELASEVQALHALDPKRIFSDRPGSTAMHALGAPMALEALETKKDPVSGNSENGA